MHGASRWSRLGVLACVMACGGETDSAPHQRDPGEPTEDFVESCRLWCALEQTLRQPCEPGEAIRHGVRLGSGEIPAEPPTSDDPECNARCLSALGRSECWNQLADYYDCLADAVWICPPEGDGWGSNQCGVQGTDPAVCWEE